MKILIELTEEESKKLIPPRTYKGLLHMYRSIPYITKEMSDRISERYFKMYPVSVTECVEDIIRNTRDNIMYFDN